MIDDLWLPDDLTDDKDLDLVSLTSSSLDYEIGKVRAFVVALLQDVNDHQAAAKVNDILVSANRFLGPWRNW